MQRWSESCAPVFSLFLYSSCQTFALILPICSTGPVLPHSSAAFLVLATSSHRYSSMLTKFSEFVPLPSLSSLILYSSVLQLTGPPHQRWCQRRRPLLYRHGYDSRWTRSPTSTPNGSNPTTSPPAKTSSPCSSSWADPQICRTLALAEPALTKPQKKEEPPPRSPLPKPERFP
jgi:hypothetical protein